MTKKDRLKQMAEDANKLFEQAKEEGIVDSDYYRTLKDELSHLMKQSDTQLVNLNSIRRFSSSSKINRTMYVLSRYLKSPHATLEGVQKMNEKRIRTLHEKYGLSRKDAIRFIDVISSDKFDYALQQVSYIGYQELVNLAMNNSITVDDILEAEKIVDDYSENFKYMKFKSKKEKNEYIKQAQADMLISLLTKKG